MSARLSSSVRIRFDEARRAEELVPLVATKKTTDDAADELLSRVGHGGSFLARAFAHRACTAFFSAFRLRGITVGNHAIAHLGPGVRDRIAAELCPHSMQRSPRLAAQASRSWSQLESPLQ